MNFLRKLWWKYYGDRRLADKLSQMTVPQLNLLEARMMNADAWSEALGKMFDRYRAEKVA